MASNITAASEHFKPASGVGLVHIINDNIVLCQVLISRA
jgi:hypothetical protein